jgi:hypothetical protein
MGDRNEPDGVLKAWQAQATTPFRMTADDVRRRMEAMDSKRRRAVIDLYLTFGLISLVLIALAAMSPGLLMKLGAAMSMLGFGYLLLQVRRQYGPLTAEPPDTSVRAYQAELQRRLEFTRKGLWARLLSITPGPLVFSLGFAAAYPKAAPIIYVQLATFILVVIAVVPMTRAKARKLQRELDEVVQLGQ